MHWMLSSSTSRSLKRTVSDVVATLLQSPPHCGTARCGTARHAQPTTMHSPPCTAYHHAQPAMHSLPPCTDLCLDTSRSKSHQANIVMASSRPMFPNPCPETAPQPQQQQGMLTVQLLLPVGSSHCLAVAVLIHNSRGDSQQPLLLSLPMLFAAACSLAAACWLLASW
jgi:hypothetical protein